MIKNYLASLPDIDYPDFRLLIEDVSKRYADNTAFRMRQTDGSFAELSFSEAYRQIRTLAAWLLQAGIRKGDRVGLLSENRIEWTLSYLAAVYAGIIIVPFDIYTHPENLSTYAAFAELSGMIYSTKYRESALQMISACPQCSSCICLDEASPASAQEVSFRQLVRSPAQSYEQTALPELAPADAASIIFTSGTTGNPKGVTLSHHGIIANVNASYQSLPIDEHDNFVAVLPFHHTYPTTCSFISPYAVGGSVSIVDKIVGPRIIADVKDTGGTIIIGVPLLFDKLKKGIEAKLKALPPLKRNALAALRFISRAGLALKLHPGKVLFKGLRTQAGLASVRLLVSGGGPLSASTADFFQELGFTIVQGYGMSENGPLISTNTIRHYDNKSAGLTVKNTTIRIAKPGPDGIGEIEVSSPSLMLGYFRNKDASAEVFTPDGYLRTGDLGYMDSRGFLFISGRSKNMIVTAGGKNVFPEEIEALFPQNGPIAEVMILGQKTSQDQGERIMAVCVPDYEGLAESHGGKIPSEAEIDSLIRQEVAKINRNLESYKKIEKIIIRTEPFEKTASDKIKRFLYKDYATQT